jgi:hypothetical protein
VTRIPELEQELVAAAARLRSPRRLVRPAVRAALAVGVAAVVVVLAVVVAGLDDGDRRQQPAGAQPVQPNVNGDSAPGAFVPERQRIARTANKWARLFAASDFSASCEYMAQPACEREACVRPGPEPIPNCTRPSPAFRLSFAGAKVEDVEIKGDRAAARFSNGEAVELERVSGDDMGGVWLIHKWGRNAGRGFFE